MDTDIFEKLYPFQKDMVSESIKMGSGILHAFCGSGKTIVSYSIATSLQANSMLVVCPKSVLMNWGIEARKFSDFIPFPVMGNKVARNKIYNNFLEQVGNKVLVTTYDQIRIDFDFYAGISWPLMVLDEGHYICNIRSQRHKAVKKIPALVKLAATATPIGNKAEDIYGVLAAVGRSLGNYYSFRNRYILLDLWGSTKGYKNMDELAYRIKPFMVRKTLEEAKFELPERTDTDIEFELSPKEANLYNQIKQELLFELSASDVSKLSSPMVLQMTLTKLGKLQEMTDSCELLGDSTESSKLDVLKEHLSNSIVNGNKAVIFTKFERMARILERELSDYHPLIITGDVDTETRQLRLDSFRIMDSHKVFICTEAGGLGVNMEAANLVYSYDLPFSLSKLEQRQGRIRWHTQDRPVFFYNLLAQLPKGKKSIDHWVKEKLLKKQEISDKLLLSDIKELLQ